MLGFSKLKLIHISQASKFHSSKIIFDKIIIPARIKRGPTDILRAIADTIKEDKTRANYKYYDDPYFTPLRKIDQKVYILSKESGKSAARWVRDKFPQYLDHQPDDPIIKKFLPRPFLDEEAEEFEANEDMLNQFLDDAQIPNAIKVFERCPPEELSRKTLQKLLESICFSNENSVMDPDNIDTFLFHEKDGWKEANVKLWNDGGLSERIFNMIKDDGTKPYCAIIRGMCKFGQDQQAWQLYQDAIANNITLDTETISYVIRSTRQLPRHVDRWKAVEDIIANMNEAQIPPTLSIMNSILFIMFESRMWKRAKEKSLQLLTEFEQHNILPSLTSFYYIVKIFYHSREKSSNILSKILDYLENTEITVRSRYDNRFFGTAMMACSKNIKDWQLALRLNDLLNRGNNYQFNSGVVSSSIYYRNFLLLSFQYQTLDSSIKLYDDLVPHKYIPETDVLREFIKCLGVYDALEHLPKVWSDILTMSPISLSDFIFEMVLMIINKHNLESCSEELKARLLTVTWDIWGHMNTQNIRQSYNWTVGMFSDLISILERCQEDAKVLQVAMLMAKLGTHPISSLTIQAIEHLYKSSMRLNNLELSFKCTLALKQIRAPSFEEISTELKGTNALSEEQIEKLEEEMHQDDHSLH